jgi:hypothetical protein
VCSLDVRLRNKRLFPMNITLSFLMFFTLVDEALFEIFKGVFFPLELGKVAPIASQFYIAFALHNTEHILLYLAGLLRRDITRENDIRKISESNIVACSEALVNPILLFICVFVKHRTHIRNFVVMRYP